MTPPNELTKREHQDAQFNAHCPTCGSQMLAVLDADGLTRGSYCPKCFVPTEDDFRFRDRIHRIR
jgi:hypothetical protein